MLGLARNRQELRRKGAAARERVQKRYRWAKIVEGIARCHRELVERAPTQQGEVFAGDGVAAHSAPAFEMTITGEQASL